MSAEPVSDPVSALNPLSALGKIEAFAALSNDAREAVAEKFACESVASGAYLFRQGATANTICIVVSGRFGVFVDGCEGQVAEIGPGQPVGEIAFFSGGKRTASVKAQRDSVVMRLSRADFDDLAQRTPSLYPAVVKTLANRLAETTAGRDPEAFVVPKTVAICRAGGGAMPAGFVEGLRAHFEGAGERVLFLEHDNAAKQLKSDQTFASLGEMGWFNELESRYDTIFYICDDDLNSWSEKAIRQADHVVAVGNFASRARGGLAPNPIELLAASLHERNNIRLAFMHDTRGAISGTREWLDARPWAGMHHHLQHGSRDDIARLLRFILGQAVGLVACGGGAYTAAHVGMFSALSEAGYSFDIMGGTSGGAAMAAAFALGVDGADIDARLGDMFVKRKAMGRWNVPRYSLLDHSVFDDALRAYYGEGDIADMWMPFFAVATNLSRNALHVIRKGPLWQGVRTSSAIPALLPPSITEDGEMLVDGCLVDNVPLHPMRQIKAGPNVVLQLDVANAKCVPGVTADLPARGRLMRKMIMPGQQSVLPDAPGPQAVLMRALMRERRDIAADLTAGDLMLAFPVPEAFGILDWTKYRELRWAGYDFARSQLHY